MKRKIVLVGAGGHAKSCINLIERINEFKIIGLTDSKKKGYLLNYKILGDDTILEQKKFKNINLCLSFGSIFNIKLREKIFKKLKNKGFKFPILISKESSISKFSKIGSGTMIMGNTFINADVSIGENCIINNNSLIEHDVKIGNNSQISTSVTINGSCRIGSNCFIGTGSIIRNNINIENNTFIKMASIIKK
tara:strand:- start:8689 stop:9267 length:579 start_codon:yes stop_codon:yes gene_type:complete